MSGPHVPAEWQMFGDPDCLLMGPEQESHQLELVVQSGSPRNRMWEPAISKEGLLKCPFCRHRFKSHQVVGSLFVPDQVQGVSTNFCQHMQSFGVHLDSEQGLQETKLYMFQAFKC